MEYENDTESNDTVETPQENTTESTQEVIAPVGPETPGYNPVDLAGVDETKAKEIKDRMGYFFRQDKQRQGELNEMRAVLQEQAALVQQLSSGVGQVVTHLKTEKFTETKAALTQQVKSAFEAGDINAMIEAQNKLIELGIQEKTAVKPKENIQKPPQLPSANQIGQDALSAGEISQEEMMYLDAWQAETVNGQPMRAWAVNRGSEQQPDMRYINGVLTAQDVFTDPRYQSLTFQQKLDEMDRRMGTKKTTAGQPVMGGNLTRPSKTAKIELTDQQKRIAVKTKFGSSKGAKSDADYIEAFSKQVAATRGAANGRR